jgi:hypothetical protein
MIDLDLERLYVLLSTAFFIVSLASAFYFMGHAKPGRTSSFTVGAFLFAAASSLVTLVTGVILLSRISDTAGQPLTPRVTNALELLDTIVRSGLAGNFLALLVGLALVGWLYSRTMALVSTALAALAFVVAVAAFALT